MSAQSPELTTLYLYLTAGCNCSCRHCWIVGERASHDTDRSEVLEFEVLRHLLEQALPLGLQRLKWTGGEPTLHPHFASMLELQKEYGLSGAVETNGMLLDDPLAELMLQVGIDQVSVSLDSANEAIHDAIRGVAGGYKRTIQGIRALVAAGLRPELILTLQRTNHAGLPAYFELAAQLGARAVKLNLLQPVLRGQALASRGEGLEVREILAIAENLLPLSRDRYPFPVRIDLPMAFRPLSRVISGDHDGTCGITNVLGVLPRGEYALCGIGQHVPELALGGIMSSSLRDVWSNHPVLLKVRQGLPDRLAGICSRCLMKRACLGSCVAANYQLSGDLLAPYWFCEEADAIGRFPGSRKS